MAIALLLDESNGGTHHAKYDLESLMYVLLFCATMLDGPNDTWRQEADFQAYRSIPLREWFDLRHINQSYTKMGRTKTSHMVHFEESVIQNMAPFFSPLFPGIRQLKDAVFPPGTQSSGFRDSPIDHRRMIDIFNHILATLPEERKTRRGIKRGPQEPHEHAATRVTKRSISSVSASASASEYLNSYK
jgi:hypothetical protein